MKKRDVARRGCAHAAHAKRHRLELDARDRALAFGRLKELLLADAEREVASLRRLRREERRALDRREVGAREVGGRRTPKETGTAGRRGALPPAKQSSSGPVVDDEMAEIEEILKRRGIS